ncbi:MULTISPECIES: isochorismatase family protein [Rhodococcus]|uniref:2,3-dihydro-2,3-dihydroxybenzoate synthetase n=1 Tax=Rhodococcoides kyotonense TaxID=398843 RepID=A0A177YH57_9NOCA|nr:MULTISPECIES: isochorismatase family protein [Rhodococcus]NIL75140.1 Isochorismatase [Rhodococcus sp. B10]OAK54569.1 2,3-dihydro-2,3-dihydroxybenzoate synthetase [Rhodococcus kyotonensis]
MAIPKITSYSIPGRDEVPANVVDWELDPDRAALLIHDMQNYFIDAYADAPELITPVVEKISALREQASELGIPVVYTMQPGDQHPSRRGILADFWGPGLGAGRDTDVIDALAPRRGDIEVTKWRYSAFQRTDLRELLGHHGRDQLIVTGVYAHMGCMLSAAEAFMSDVCPFLVLDATADFSRDEHVMAATYAAKRCGAVVTATDVADALGRQPVAAGAAR